MGDVDVKVDRLQDLLDPRAEVERLADGFWFTEGPVWEPETGRLYFSDMPGDVRRSWHPDEGVIEVRRPSNKANGTAFDASGNLLVCEHATSRLIRENRDGTTTVLATHYDGKELNSPNDVIVTSDGTIYFSDPSFGRMPVFGIEREPELPFRGLYRLRPGSSDVELVDSDFDQPNGVCTSPDETLLYVNDTGRAHIKVYDRAADGGVGSSRILLDGIGDGVIENGVVDGMKCDASGAIWVTAPGGIWIISPEGEHMGTIRLPENAGNLNWGGPDWSDLYMTCNTGLYRISTRTTAAPVPNTTRAIH